MSREFYILVDTSGVAITIEKFVGRSIFINRVHDSRYIEAINNNWFGMSGSRKRRGKLLQTKRRL